MTVLVLTEPFVDLREECFLPLSPESIQSGYTMDSFADSNSTGDSIDLLDSLRKNLDEQEDRQSQKSTVDGSRVHEELDDFERRLSLFNHAPDTRPPRVRTVQFCPLPAPTATGNIKKKSGKSKQARAPHLPSVTTSVHPNAAAALIASKRQPEGGGAAYSVWADDFDVTQPSIHRSAFGTGQTL